MKNILTLFLSILAVYATARNNNTLQVKDPAIWSSTGTPASLRDVTIQITPQGLFAQVDFTATVSPDGGNWSFSQQLEAVMTFDLPEGSFVHDSWLWLNDSVVVPADIVERNKAVATYSSIVRRRSDPSLLLKNLTNSYNLNIYPVKTTFHRKFKFTYSTPFLWKAGKAIVPLPTNLLGKSKVVPSINLEMVMDSSYKAPNVINDSYTGYHTGQVGDSVRFSIPGRYRSANDITTDLFAGYSIPANAQVYAYASNTTEGVYQFLIPPQDSTPATRRKVVYMIDWIEPVTNYSYYGSQSMMLPEILGAIRRSLTRDYSPTDSFALFFHDAYGNIVQAGTNWAAATDAELTARLNAVNPSTGYTSYSDVRELLRKGMLMAATDTNTRAVLFAVGPTRQDSTFVDTTIRSLQTYLGGSFHTPLDIVDLYQPSYYNNNFVNTGNHPLFDALAQQTGGSAVKVKGILYDNYIGNTISDLNADQFLYRQTASAGHTAIHSISLPVNGISYGSYQLNNLLEYQPGLPWNASARYFGTLPSSGNIQLQYMQNGTLQSRQVAYNTVSTLSGHGYKAWLDRYMIWMQQQNISKATIVDSSVKNRVLHSYTAFLAIDITEVPTAVVSLDTITTETVKAFPNPFTDKLTLTSETEIARIRITDLQGRLILMANPKAKTYEWNGQDSQGKTVPAGLYFITVADKDGNLKTIKVQKL